MRIRRALLICGLITVCFNLCSSEFTPAKQPAVIWALADSHGGYDGVLSALKNIGLLDSAGNWQGGNSRAVYTGNLVEHGADTLKILDLFIRLEQQANATGGLFQVVMDDGALKALTGDVRALASGEYAAFIERETPELRENYFQHTIRFRQKWRQQKVDASANSAVPVINSSDPRALFNALHPPGFFTRFETFLPSSRYGQWLLRRPFVAEVDGYLFAHGGLSHQMTYHSVAALNQTLAEQLTRYVTDWQALIAAGDLPVLSDPDKRAEQTSSKGKITSLSQVDQKQNLFKLQNPAVYQGAIYCHPYYESHQMRQMLKLFNARYLITGNHSSALNRVEFRLGKTVVAAATAGAGEAGDNKNHWVNISDHRLKGVDPNGQQYAINDGAYQPIEYPKGQSKTAIKKLLTESKIIRDEKLNVGITQPHKLTLKLTDGHIKALFRVFDSDPGMQYRAAKTVHRLTPDRYQFDLAAFELSELLGLGLVPVSTERQVGKEKGLVQFWVDDTYMYWEAEEYNRPYVGHCALADQVNLMRIFDLLIHNTDRNSTNILVKRETGQILWIDHSRAFSTRHRFPKEVDKSQIQLTEEIQQALNSLEREPLDNLLSPWLNRKQIRAIIKRRDMILRRYGESQ